MLPASSDNDHHNNAVCDMTKKSIMHIHVKHFYFFFIPIFVFHFQHCNNSYTIQPFKKKV